MPGQGRQRRFLPGGLGLDVAATGLLGRENAGVFEALFRAKRIEDRFVRADGATRTNIKLVDSDATTDINLPGLTATGELLTEAEATLLTLAEPGALVVLAGSLPLGCPPDHYGRLIARLQSRACAYCWTPAAMRWPMRWPAPPCPGPSSPTATNWPNGRASR